MDADALLRALPLHASGVLLFGDGGGGGEDEETCSLPWPATVAALGLSPARLTAPTAVAHAGRALRLLATLLASVDAVPLLASLGRLVSEGGWVGAAVDAAVGVLCDAAGGGVGPALADAAAGGAGDAAAAARALGRADAVPAALAVLIAVFTPRKSGGSSGGGPAGHGGLAGGFHGLSVARRAGMAVERLLSSPRAGGPALPAAFDAVRTLHRMVGAALAGASEVGSTKGAAAGATPTPTPASAAATPTRAALAAALADCAGEGMEALAFLASSPVFHAGLAARDPGLGSPLRLIGAGLDLLARFQGDPAATASPGAAAAVDLLAARSLCLLVTVAEHGEPPFLDVVAANEHTAAMARAVADGALGAAAAALGACGAGGAGSGGLALGPPLTPRSAGAGQLDLAALAAAELLTDDSNYREVAIGALAEAVADALSLPVEEVEEGGEGEGAGGGARSRPARATTTGGGPKSRSRAGWRGGARGRPPLGRPHLLPRT